MEPVQQELVVEKQEDVVETHKTTEPKNEIQEC